MGTKPWGWPQVPTTSPHPEQIALDADLPAARAGSRAPRPRPSACYERGMSWSLRVGAVQMCSTDDLTANLATVRGLTARAAEDGARLVVLPECFSFLGRREGDKLGIAESLDEASLGGPILSTLRELATKHGIHIVGGGTPELVAGDVARTYNTALAIAPNGDLAARYRKIHLFDVDIPGGAVLRESDATAPGTDLVVLPIDGAKVGAILNRVGPKVTTVSSSPGAPPALSKLGTLLTTAGGKLGGK